MSFCFCVRLSLTRKIACRFVTDTFDYFTLLVAWVLVTWFLVTWVIVTWILVTWVLVTWVIVTRVLVTWINHWN